MTNTILFVQLFMGFLLIVADSSCPITLSPSRVAVKYGHSVSINCTADGELREMGWESPQEGIGVEMANYLTWSVTNLTTEEALCFVNMGPDQQCTQRADIVLYNYPETVNIISNSTDGFMVEGAVYHLICDVHGVVPAEKVSVMWYINETYFQKERMIYFSPSRTQDRAEIRCEAHMDLMPEGPYINVSSQIFKINVNFGPEMLCTDVTIAEGETLDSKCPVRGNPTPYVEWFKNQQQINSTAPLTRNDSGIYFVNTSGLAISQSSVNVSISYGPELNCPHYYYTALEHTIINLNCTVGGYPKPEVALYKDGEEVYLGIITRKDAGDYVLVASTETIVVNQTFEVIVYYPPSEIFELESSSFTLGSSVYLKCYARGNPRPKYSWIYYNISNVFEENVEESSILVIQNATTFNMGNYTCLASNEYGTVFKTARLTVEGAKQECPLQISPERMVLEYNSARKTATCKTHPTSANEDIYWLDNSGNNNSSDEWVADTHNWNANPVCKGVFKGIGECEKKLDFILYKKPDSVSISIKGDNGTLMENDSVTLICEITSVAPAKSVIVHWFKGNESFTPPNEVQVSCSKPNIDEIKESVQMWFKTNITLNRTNNGVDFFCGAVLNLPEIQAEPNQDLTKSSPLNVTVYYLPSINTTKLSHTVPVFSGYAEDLKCEADGNPRPEITWTADVALPPQQPNGLISVIEKGKYTCKASNPYGSDTHVVEVIEKVDYLPLIAGFVAVTVVIISMIFIFIYSIYYKNTKMRRYNLKNPKLGAHNGNVAHNGWDLPLPMTKL
ncbi:hemicentin-1-like [Periophthalmus magnuspinnatus]|uniref:hemicentin-1-like n=1 Tax=Periophthalmus magnuspinnatus TaxID=409849 RepID=UPI00145A9B5A|nr:hemicentin-1-like [Periophthalmus magnuspinnatus]